MKRLKLYSYNSKNGEIQIETFATFADFETAKIAFEKEVSRILRNKKQNGYKNINRNQVNSFGYTQGTIEYRIYLA